LNQLDFNVRTDFLHPAPTVAPMNISGIGVQQILPQSGINSNAPPVAGDSGASNGDEGSATPDRSPPAPGTGQVVDTTA
jgi:hypothetical protein